MKFVDWLSRRILERLGKEESAKLEHITMFNLWNHSGACNVASGQMEVYNDLSNNRRMYEISFDSYYWTGRATEMGIGAETEIYS